VAAYLLSDASGGETNRAIGVLTSGDIEVVRDYILSYGAWTPLISAMLMALQAILAFLPSFIWTSPTACLRRILGQIIEPREGRFSGGHLVRDRARSRPGAGRDGGR
jgi:hypothetical protein